MQVNLMSDTVTRPTVGMIEYMSGAAVGDDVFGMDPTVNTLQQKMADMFGMEAGLFCPSGTMANQIAIKCHTHPLDEIICEEGSHVYQYETAGYAFHSGVSVRLLRGHQGKLNSPMLAACVRPLQDWLPNTRLVVVENTTNRGGGSWYASDELQDISEFCQSKGWALHMDGARVFNALIASGQSPQEMGQWVDSLTVCLSKGLGAPVGSLLLGSADLIKQAKRYRKVMGGGMRQAGYLAAAGLYALEHHIDRLKEDHRRAKLLGAVLGKLNYVVDVQPVLTNIILFDLATPAASMAFLEALKREGVLAAPFGPSTVRFVTHLDVEDRMIEHVIQVLEAYEDAV